MTDSSQQPKDNYFQYSEVSDQEVLEVDYEAKILEKYPCVDKFVMKQPFTKTDPIFLNSKPLKDHYLDVQERLKPIIPKLATLKQEANNEIIRIQKVVDLREQLEAIVHPKFWILAHPEFRLVCRKYLILQNRYWITKIRRVSLTCTELDINLTAAKDMYDLTTQLIEQPANVVFKIKNLESFIQKTELSETVEIRKNYGRLKISIDAYEVLIRFYMQLAKQADDQKILNEKYLSQFINKQTYHSMCYSEISLELEPILFSLLYDSEVKYKELVKEQTINEQKVFAIQFLEKQKLEKGVMPYLVYPLQRMLYEFTYAASPVKEDENHCDVVNFLNKWAEENELTKGLFVPLRDDMKEVINLFDELTFTYFPIDMAYLIDQAINKLNNIVPSVEMADKIHIVACTISFSYLPDPIFIMNKLLEVITNSAFPTALRDACNIYVSSCQLMIIENWKEKF